MRRRSCSTVLTLVLLAACGGGGGSSAPPATEGSVSAADAPTTLAPAPTTRAEPGAEPAATTGSAATTAADATTHDGTIDQGESAVLVDQLRAVPGFRYGDVSDAERTVDLSFVPASVLGAAFHTVRSASTGEEIGFIALYLPDPADAMHAPDNEVLAARSTLGTDSPELLTFGNQHVYAATDPASNGSEHVYTWLRHGTQGSLDGSDPTQLEQWLAGYFAEPYLGPEPAPLAARAVPLDGWAYTDAVDRPDELDAVVESVPGSDASLHYVFDRTHMFGGLVLLERAGGLAAGDLGTAVGTYLAAMGVDPAALERGADLDAGGTTVVTLAAPVSGQVLTAYAWTWPDGTTGGWLLTTRPDLGEPFVTELVAADPIG